MYLHILGHHIIRQNKLPLQNYEHGKVNDLLLFYIRFNNLHGVKNCIKYNANIHMTSIRCILHAANYAKNLDMIKFIVENGEERC